MRLIAAVLACLLSAGFGRRVVRSHDLAADPDGERLAASDPTKAVADLLLMSDPSTGFIVSASKFAASRSNADQQVEDLMAEDETLFRSPPEGIETLDYKVMCTIEGPLLNGKPELIEVRAYEPYMVAKTSATDEDFGSDTGRAHGAGFRKLKSYLFGENVNHEDIAMLLPDWSFSMTLPVEISKTLAGAGNVSLVLPDRFGDSPPMPLEGSGITIGKVPAQLVAVKAWSGLATAKGIERQKKGLLESLADDGAFVPADEKQVSILQYNSVLTVPWKRRNEVAVPVTIDSSEGSSSQPAASPVETPAAPDGAKGNFANVLRLGRRDNREVLRWEEEAGSQSMSAEEAEQPDVEDDDAIARELQDDADFGGPSNDSNVKSSEEDLAESPRTWAEVFGFR